MKIYLISNMYPSKQDPDYGVFVKNTAESLIQKGGEISCSSLIRGRSGNKIITYIKHYLSVIKNYLFSDFDIIYVHFISHNSPILVLLHLLFGKKKPLVVNVHGSDVVLYNHGSMSFFNKKLLSYIDLLIVPSDYFKALVLDTFSDFNRGNIYVYPSGGVDKSCFTFKQNNGFENTLTLGFVSRIELAKGWEVFLESLGLLKSNQINFNAIIAGKGSDSNKLLEAINDKELTDCVKYIGAVSQQELSKLYQELDLFIFPTMLQESLGLVGLEAMACSIPVIASNYAGPTSYIKEGVNGYLFDKGKSQSLVKAIQKYLKLTDIEKSEMKKNALSTAMNYESSKVNCELFSEFKKLIQ